MTRLMGGVGVTDEVLFLGFQLQSNFSSSNAKAVN